MSEGEVERWIALAGQQMGQGQLGSAVDSLRRALTDDPEHPEAHALLALCLLDLRRLHAAEHEAGLAMTLEAESSLARYASVRIAIARRKFTEAEELSRLLLEQEPDNPLFYRTLADIYDLTGRGQESLALLEKALELGPNDPATLVDLGEWHLGRGDLPAAEARATTALRLEPENHAGLILMGRLLLRHGRVDEARDHAVWALRSHPASRRALHLLAEIKARSSWLLGLWWRYSTWMGTLGDGRAIVVLLFAFVLYRVGTITADGFQQPELASYIEFLWYGVVAYTWFGPGIFQNSLRKELASVRLDKNF